MHILALAASALLAAPAPAIDVPSVQRDISVFQQDFPISDKDGETQYRSVSRAMFDATGRIRQPDLAACGAACNFVMLHMDERSGVEWSQGSTITVEDLTRPIFMGQKGRIDFVGGQGAVRIDDYSFDGSLAEAMAGDTPRHTMTATFSGTGRDWTYYRTRSADGAEVMRLVIVWDAAVHPAAI